MATKKNIAVVIATIKGLYPYYAKDGNIELLAKTWLLLLQEYSDDIINKALLLCLKENEQPPTPAHIIKKIKGFTAKPYPTEMWAVLVKNLNKVFDLQDKMWYSNSQQRQELKDKCREIYGNLPKEIQIYLGSYSEFIRMANTVDNETALSIEKTRFLKAIPEIQEEQELRLTAAKLPNMITENSQNKNISK